MSGPSSVLTPTGWPHQGDGTRSTWTDVLAARIEAGALDPGAAWRDTVSIAGAALTESLSAQVPVGGSVITGLHPLRTSQAEPVWPLDLDPAPEDLVVISRRDLDPSGDLRLVCFPAAALDLRESVHARGTGLWGGTEVVLHGTEQPVGVVSTYSGPAAAVGPDAVLLLIAGAHAVGVANRFREAFVAKAAVTKRGWSRDSLLADPTILKALLVADSSLAAATALLAQRGREADAAGLGAVPTTAAQFAAAGIHALDSAREAVNQLLALTGASARFDGNPMQESALHLSVLGQHGMYSRASRLDLARSLAGLKTGAPTEEKP